MKTSKIKAYTAKELQKKFPKGFERAHEDYQKSVYEMGVSWGNEISDSLKAVFEFTDGVRLRDWSIDALLSSNRAKSANEGQPEFHVEVIKGSDRKQVKF